MDRRRFISTSIFGAVSVGMGIRCDARKKRDDRYSIVILGDTHFDTKPDTVYHSDYNEPTEWLNRVQRAEFARNGDMWEERCPRLVKRAAGLVDENTRMIFQMGDLIQGDCGKGEVHRRMLADVMNSFKKEFGGLPLVTVVGNHDIRGTDAEATYHEYMPMRLSQELGQSITKTTFSFNIGDDAYIFLDFNRPDDAEIEKLLSASKGARHTFIVSHGPVLAYDGADNCRWFFHGSDNPEHNAARRHFREEFAKRDAIVLCGHIHTTEFADWRGDGGRITQMTMNSVWSDEELSKFTITAQGAEEYGKLNRAGGTNDNGSSVKDASALHAEYRPGLREYINSKAAGSYKMNVSEKRVTIDFYGGDSLELTRQFVLR